jgi:hypothetical protein
MTNNKYTFTGLTGVMATITGAFYYQKISYAYSTAISLTKAFYSKEDEITQVAKMINVLTNNENIKNITGAWISIQEKGGVEQFIINTKKEWLDQCATQAGIDKENAKKTISCIKEVVSSASDDNFNKILKGFGCYSPENGATYEEVMNFGKCLIAEGQDLFD